MKIYINNDYNILSIDKEPEEYFMMNENYEDIKDSMFYNMCSTCMYLWKHEPQYKIALDSNYNVIKDSFGEIIYELDQDGNKIQTGWSTYPSVNYTILEAIQKEYDRQQIETQEVMLSVIDNNYRLSKMELGL